MKYEILNIHTSRARQVKSNNLHVHLFRGRICSEARPSFSSASSALAWQHEDGTLEGGSRRGFGILSVLLFGGGVGCWLRRGDVGSPLRWSRTCGMGLEQVVRQVRKGFALIVTPFASWRHVVGEDWMLDRERGRVASTWKPH
jgi:hypothetical protein